MVAEVFFVWQDWFLYLIARDWRRIILKLDNKKWVWFCNDFLSHKEDKIPGVLERFIHFCKLFRFPLLCCRYVVVFNPVEQNRLCVVSVLVNTPHVRVLTEEGQPMAVQISPVWQSLTDMNPDVYQVTDNAESNNITSWDLLHTMCRGLHFSAADRGPVYTRNHTGTRCMFLCHSCVVQIEPIPFKWAGPH